MRYPAGVIRDVALPDEFFRQFGLGEGVKLNPTKRYKAYKGDSDALTPLELKELHQHRANGLVVYE
jgi:hypothetical protein